jgi:hypothetical protein
MNEFVIFIKNYHMDEYEFHDMKFTIPSLKSDQMNDERYMGETRFPDEKCNTGSNSVTIVCEI